MFFWLSYTIMVIGFGVVLTALIGDEFDEREMHSSLAALYVACGWTALAVLLAPLFRSLFML